MWPPMWTRNAAFGRCCSRLAPRSRRTTCTGPRGCSRRTRRSAPDADRGQRRGHERVRRAQDGLAGCTPAKCSAASAPPAQLDERDGGQRRCSASQACLEARRHRRPRTSGWSRAPRRSARAGARGRDGRSRSRSGRSQAALGRRKLLSSSSRQERQSEARAATRFAGRRTRSRAWPANRSQACDARRQACQTGRTVPSSAPSALQDQLERLRRCARGNAWRCRSPRRAGGSRLPVDQVAVVTRAAIRARRRELAPILAPARPQQRPEPACAGGRESGGAVDPVRAGGARRASRRWRPRSLRRRASGRSAPAVALSRSCSRWR